MSGDVELDAWLSQLGYGLAASKSTARAALEAAQLTRAGKTRMSTEKVPRAEALLAEQFFLHCAGAECVAFAKASGRTPVLCDPKSTCARCGGSDNQRAVRDLLEACRQKSVARLVIVGGAPSTREELERLLGTQVELRLVDGTKARTLEHARGDVQWADLVLLWGATELHHKVSNQYQDTAVGPLKKKLVHIPRRGIAQLLTAALENLKHR